MIDPEWIVREHYGDLLIGENVDGGHLMATLHTGYCHPAFVERQRKNAQIMAASRELLEALQALASAAEAMGIDTELARAAIEKATGQ